jgi:hypothetical protein
MARQLFDARMNDLANVYLEKLEAHFDSDVIFFYGPIYPGIENTFRLFLEDLRSHTAEDPRRRLTILLNTPGGVAETVEKLVEIIRFHYQELYFVVPDSAMSAGTIFCMSGNKIFMDYSSSLGPIDPQIFNGKELVPALGYLDQVEKMINKSVSGDLSKAEYALLQSIDLAQLSQFEQARTLTITLLKQWLVEYKFSDWEKHETTPSKVGKKVTLTEKQKRAEQIATSLSDNKKWHSHGRKIGINVLTKTLKLKIDDYSDDKELRGDIRNYNDFLTEYIKRHNFISFLHSKYYF